jgi:hypothetical protein
LNDHLTCYMIIVFILYFGMERKWYPMLLRSNVLENTESHPAH